MWCKKKKRKISGPGVPPNFENFLGLAVEIYLGLSPCLHNTPTNTFSVKKAHPIKHCEKR
jgi:hypothetical protein